MPHAVTRKDELQTQTLRNEFEQGGVFVAVLDAKGELLAIVDPIAPGACVNPEVFAEELKLRMEGKSIQQYRREWEKEPSNITALQDYLAQLSENRLLLTLEKNCKKDAANPALSEEVRAFMSVWSAIARSDYRRLNLEGFGLDPVERAKDAEAALKTVQRWRRGADDTSAWALAWTDAEHALQANITKLNQYAKHRVDVEMKVALTREVAFQKVTDALERNKKGIPEPVLKAREAMIHEWKNGRLKRQVIAPPAKAPVPPPEPEIVKDEPDQFEIRLKRPLQVAEE